MHAKLEDEDELMFRQIHPSFVHDGQPSSQPFCPTPKDEQKLSLDRSALLSADKSYTAYIARGQVSAGVYGLTVGEFGSVEIPCLSDPIVSIDEPPI